MMDPHPNARATASRGRPVLSVSIPIRREDPRPLVERLGEEIAREGLAARVEIVVLDDGGDDPALAQRVASSLARIGARTRLLAATPAIGRAAARNRLASAAHGAWSLFLEPDSLPAADDFLAKWLDVIAGHAPWIAVGAAHGHGAGRSGPDPLVLALAPTDGAPPPLASPASLLVHCDILAREPFDEAFVGRGWEDVEWAVRARRRAPILMVDMPLTRTPPADEAAALERCRSAARNFARLVRRHPELVRSSPAFRAAQVFASAPALSRLRPLLARAAQRPGLAPRGVRALAAELWRASWYGEALR